MTWPRQRRWTNYYRVQCKPLFQSALRSYFTNSTTTRAKDTKRQQHKDSRKQQSPKNTKKRTHKRENSWNFEWNGCGKNGKWEQKQKQKRTKRVVSWVDHLLQCDFTHYAKCVSGLPMSGHNYFHQHKLAGRKGIHCHSKDVYVRCQLVFELDIISGSNVQLE